VEKKEALKHLERPIVQPLKEKERHFDNVAGHLPRF